jgi:hypothetical protein
VTVRQPFGAFVGILQSVLVDASRLSRRDDAGYKNDRCKRHQQPLESK